MVAMVATVAMVQAMCQYQLGMGPGTEPVESEAVVFVSRHCI